MSVISSAVRNMAIILAGVKCTQHQCINVEGEQRSHLKGEWI